MVAHSSGNHGFAVAYAAALLRVPAAIVVPDTAPPVKTDLIKSVGAELVVVAPTLAARIEASARIASDRGYAEIPPFDDRRVIAGQGTVGLEIAEDLTAGPGARRPAAVLVPVGGGGLVSGIAVAVKALLPGTRVIGVEPEFAADARDSLRSGARVAWAAADTARTAADSLRVEQVGELTFPHIKALVDDIVTVSEAGAARGGATPRAPGPAGGRARRRGRGRGGAVQGSGRARIDLRRTQAPVVAVLSGGNIDPTLLAELLGGSSYTG